MLRAIVICPDRELSERLDAAVQATGEVAVLRILGLAGMASLLAVIAMLWLLSKKPKGTPVGA